MTKAHRGGLLLAAVLVFTGLSGSPAFADDTLVDFPDPQLRSCVNSWLRQDPQADITRDQAASLNSLNCNGRSITDLTGVEYVIGANQMHFHQAQITDLTPLSNLPRLQYLNVSDTPVADIDPLATLPTLRDLNIGNTLVTDLSPLAGLQNLDTLLAEGTAIPEIASIAGLPVLSMLALSGGPLRDLSPLSTFPILSTLRLRQAPGLDLNTIPTLPTVQTLLIQKNDVSDLPDLLSRFPDIRSVEIGDTRIGDLSGFVPGDISILRLRNSEISDPSPLGALRDSPGFYFGRLDLAGNHIVDLSGLNGPWLYQTIEALNQQVTLPPTVLGKVNKNPLRTLDGSPVIPTTTDSGVTIDPVTGDWVITETGTRSLRWIDYGDFGDDPENPLGYYGFGGVLLQTAHQDAGLSVTNPASVTVSAGLDASFTSTSTSILGSNTVSWQYSADGLTWETIPGATETTLIVPAGSAATGTRYRALHKNDFSGEEVLSEAAILTVTPAIVEPPATTQPPVTTEPTAPVLPPGGAGGLAGTGASGDGLLPALGAIILLLAGLGLRRGTRRRYSTPA